MDARHISRLACLEQPADDTEGETSLVWERDEDGQWRCIFHAETREADLERARLELWDAAGRHRGVTGHTRFGEVVVVDYDSA